MRTAILSLIIILVSNVIFAKDLYIFESSFCGPCKVMKSETWDSKIVKSLLNKRRVFTFNYETSNHKKYFDYYKVTKVPTFLFVDSDKKKYYKYVGYKSRNDVITILKLMP